MSHPLLGLCIHVHVWVHVFVTVEVKGELQVHSAGAIRLGLDTRSLTFTWDLPIILVCLISEPQGSICLHFLSSEVTNMGYHVLTWVPGN